MFFASSLGMEKATWLYRENLILVLMRFQMQFDKDVLQTYSKISPRSPFFLPLPLFFPPTKKTDLPSGEVIKGKSCLEKCNPVPISHIQKTLEIQSFAFERHSNNKSPFCQPFWGCPRSNHSTERPMFPFPPAVIAIGLPSNLNLAQPCERLETSISGPSIQSPVFRFWKKDCLDPWGCPPVIKMVDSLILMLQCL